ncbi:MAG TPA: ISL3 family transposase [Ktedonobacteraceae bacterium]|nr:ISL3 family transposase [Ktedonobacteraceae bacterium]
MEVKQVAALPGQLEVRDIEMSDNILTITVVSLQAHPTCPLCGSAAQRVHSRYCRKLADLPCSGQHVRLLMQVRKCFCDTPDCARKIFVERLTPFVEPFARVTQRLFQIVQVVGLATGGRLGVRVTDRLGIETSRHTILRRIMALPTEPVGEVTQIGIDDFSFRRGRKFGTIIVDLQTHKMLDVLPDRTAETSATWMAAHPELDIVSRDRGGDYAAAARKAAPQATQTADRFHLMKNLTEAVELTLARCRAEIRKAAYEALPEEERKVVDPLTLPLEPVALENWKPAPDPCTERERLTRQAQRQDRYEQVLALQAQGLGKKEIAKRVGITTRTLENWQKHGFPQAGRRRKRPSCFDPYASYVLSRWEQGCTNGLQLYQEIKEQGYTGTEKTVYRFLVPLRRKQQIIQKAVVPQVPLQDFSAKDAVWWFVRDPSKLDEKEQTTLTTICQASETARVTYQLVQEFRQMLHALEGEKLDEWLAKVKESQIRELQSFVFGVERDKAAVVAGLTLPHNNGLVEGKVNKLKLIKRMMFGRAEFPLLRQRVLHTL